MSLLFNMLSRLVITFLPRSKCLSISWLQSPSAVILEPPKNEVWHCFHCFPIYFPWGDGTRCHDLSFLNVLSFKPTFSFSSFSLTQMFRFCGPQTWVIRITWEAVFRNISQIYIPSPHTLLSRCLRIHLRKKLSKRFWQLLGTTILAYAWQPSAHHIPLPKGHLL